MSAEGETAVRPWPERPAESGADEVDQGLLRASLAGDLDAFDSLVERHGRKIVSVVRRCLDDPNEVDDAVQETFVRAFQRLRGYRGDASFRTWLIRIAVNVCHDRRSGAWRRRVRVGGADVDLASGRGDCRRLAEMSLLQSESDRQIREALRKLPDKQRLPIVLHFFEELSGAETAEALGWSESTVWSRIYAGCRKLQRMLAPYIEG